MPKSPICPNQEQIGPRLLSHVEKLRQLRSEIDKGICSLEAGEGKPLDIEGFLRQKTNGMAGHRPPIWSADALADLLDIWDYYANVAGRHTADKIVREIEEACRILEDHPFAGRGQKRCGLVCARSSRVRTLVFYRVKDDVAEIVRILDGRRDLDEIFAHEPTEKK